MAYFNFLASVPESGVAEFRARAAPLLVPSRVSGDSHLLAYWVETEPLAGLLRTAIDGGEVLRADLWHPLRAPTVHGPAAARGLAEGVESSAAGAADDDWLRIEVARLLGLFRHAAEAGECVVSALDHPADAERANRVRRLWAGRPAPRTPPSCPGGGVPH